MYETLKPNSLAHSLKTIKHTTNDAINLIFYYAYITDETLHPDRVVTDIIKDSKCAEIYLED